MILSAQGLNAGPAVDPPHVEEGRDEDDDSNTSSNNNDAAVMEEDDSIKEENDNNSSSDSNSSNSKKKKKKNRKSRYAGFRRKRQQQKKVAALIAEAADKRALAARMEEQLQNQLIYQQQQQQQLYYHQHQDAYNNNYNNQDPSSSSSYLPPPHRYGYVAMDCEFVGVGPSGEHSALARVVLVDWNGNAIMDELVQPEWEVTDYRTSVSGITKDMLDFHARLDFNTARQMVLRHIQGKILVGHGLENDLKALRLCHPWADIRDTATYAAYMREYRIPKTKRISLKPKKLRDLAWEKLGRTIQVYGKPHCPREDAMAALDLYKLVWQQWECSLSLSGMNGCSTSSKNNNNNAYAQSPLMMDQNTSLLWSSSHANKDFRRGMMVSY